MSQLLISPKAALDLEEIADYIALDSPRAAARLVLRFEQITRLLSEHPSIGTRCTEIAEDFPSVII